MKKTKPCYQITLTNGEDGWIVAECPGLPGAISQGKTQTEAIENIKEAIALYLEVSEVDYIVNTTDFEVKPFNRYEIHFGEERMATVVLEPFFTQEDKQQILDYIENNIPSLPEEQERSLN